MKKYKKLSSIDPVVKQLQNNVEAVINPVLTKEIINGVLIKDIVLTTGSVDKVSHKLGRKPIGYIVVKRNANSVIWDSVIDSRTISLNCSANVTVTLWIF